MPRTLSAALWGAFCGFLLTAPDGALVGLLVGYFTASEQVGSLVVTWMIWFGAAGAILGMVVGVFLVTMERYFKLAPPAESTNVFGHTEINQTTSASPPPTAT